MLEKSEHVTDRTRIYKRGSTWQVCVQIHGRQRRKSLRTSNVKQARRLAVEYERELDEAHADGRPPIQTATVRDAADALLVHKEAVGLAASSIKKYRGNLDRVCDIAESMGIDSIDRVDHAFVDAYCRLRRQETDSLNTLDDEVVLIRQLVRFAVARRMVKFDPLVGLKHINPKPTPQPCWTLEETELILACCRDRDRPLFTLLAETGMRIGEAKWLSWDDVDFEKNVLHIRGKENKKTKQKWKPKTGNIRAIPLSERAVAVLQSLGKRCQWVFTRVVTPDYPNGDDQISESKSLKALKRALKKLGLPGHLHTFRHAFISRAVVRGIPEAVIRQWVGQVDADILRLYTHIADAQSQEAMRRLNAS